MIDDRYNAYTVKSGEWWQVFLATCNVDNNNDIAIFYKMLALAETGAKWHNDRRQVAFRIFISYMTLLVLAFYQVVRIFVEERQPVFPWLVYVGVIGGLIIHFTYYRWLVSETTQSYLDLGTGSCETDIGGYKNGRTS